MTPPRLKIVNAWLAQRRISWNGGSAVCRSHFVLGSGYGIGAHRRCCARPTKTIPVTRMVPVHGASSERRHHRISDASLICPSRQSEDTGQTRQTVLCSGNGTRRLGNGRGSRRPVHSTCRRDHHFASTIPTDQIPTLDARRARALVARAPVGNDHLRPVVRAPWAVIAWDSSLSVGIFS